MKNRTKAILAALSLCAAAFAYGQHHYHAWQKVNETYSQDAYGNPVVICTWECRTEDSYSHITETQGMGDCPYPL